MSKTVKSFSVSHNPINDKDTWTNGDFVTGQIKVELAKECHIQSLWIKFKGKAKVFWSERHGQVTVSYSSKEKYFSLKQFFIREQKEQEEDSKEDCQPLLTDECGKPYSNVVAPGIHVYPFTFQFPVDQDMPPTFKGLGGTGKIQYFLEAHLSRSMRLPSTDIVKLTFIPKVVPNHNPELMNPQHDTKEKKMKLFTSGMVAMDVDLDKMGYCQGEGINVVASIQNDSSRDIKPKYCLYAKHSFFAQGARRVHTSDLLKEVGDVIPPSGHQTVSRTVTIPPETEPSIHNCGILKAEHRLRVYLDVKYASDPHIKFPIVIMRTPGPLVGAPAPEQPPAYSAFGGQPYGGPPAYRAQPAFGAPGVQPAFGAPGGQPGFGAHVGQPAFGVPGAQPAFGAPGAQPAFGAPGSQPAFGAPGVQPAFGVPGVQPAFGAPGAQPAFGAPGAQPAFGAPGAQPAFGAPGSQPAFGVPGVQPAFGVPGAQPAFGAPGAQPAFGAPGTQSAFGVPAGAQPALGTPGAPPAFGGQPPALSNPTQSGDAPPPPYGSYGMYPALSEDFLK